MVSVALKCFFIFYLVLQLRKRAAEPPLKKLLRNFWIQALNMMHRIMVFILSIIFPLLPGRQITEKVDFAAFSQLITQSNGQKCVLCSSGEFKIMFVTSLKIKFANLKWMASPWTRWELAQPGSQNLALNCQRSLLALQFLVSQRHFMSSIEQVPVVPH